VSHKLHFYKIWETLHPEETDDLDQSPLMDSGDDDESLAAIRNGMTLRKKEDCGDFWEDFMKVCGNAGALAALLGVRSEQVSQWSGKIRKALEKVKQSDSEDRSEKPEVIKTGNDGPLASQNGNLDLAQPGQTNPY